MSRIVCIRAAAVLVVAAGVAVAADPIPGVGPTGAIAKVEGKYTFTEGPAVDAVGNIYFSDIPAQKIHKIDVASGAVSVFRDKSNHANGLMVNAQGEIVACEMDGAIAAYSADGKKRRVVAGEYEGKRFNAPNDLVIDKSGGIYFTDPSFSSPKPLPQGKTCVYYVDATGKVTRLIDDLPDPNGVRLSPDEKTLYVFPSGQKKMMAYPVVAAGKLGGGKVFCELAQAKEGGNGGGDGGAVDSKGNVYITSGIGLQVFDPAGKTLGTIKFPEQPSNAAFGGKDLKTLYVTARTSVYSCAMEVTGHRYPGK
ncbi:MAG TPA: SMP-30/gluconolactonase/LRE family protein [Urbifossiella sp.]|nr:SMP-30/gluconolactonase/LRE family protein [Urbifossiella sp.]